MEEVQVFIDSLTIFLQTHLVTVWQHLGQNQPCLLKCKNIQLNSVCGPDLEPELEFVKSSHSLHECWNWFFLMRSRFSLLIISLWDKVSLNAINFSDDHITSDISKTFTLCVCCFFYPPPFFFCSLFTETSRAPPPQTFSFTFPQTEDNTQSVISTDASHSTVTNGMWASPSVRPATPLSSANEWTPFDMRNICSVSQCLGPVYEDDCWPFWFFPFCLVLCSFYLLSTVLSQGDTFILFVCILLGKQPDGAVENNQNKGKYWLSEATMMPKCRLVTIVSTNQPCFFW